MAVAVNDSVLPASSSISARAISCRRPHSNKSTLLTTVLTVLGVVFAFVVTRFV
jgi:hypothetical protein